MSKLLANRIQTPDGTILQSYHSHDYRTHADANGEIYMVDGGLLYRRRSVNIIPAKDLSVFTDSPHDEIRQAFCWGTRGKDGRQPPTFKPLYLLDTDHIKAILETQTQLTDHIIKVFQTELQLREDMSSKGL